MSSWTNRDDLQDHINAYRVARAYLEGGFETCAGRRVTKDDVLEVYQGLQAKARQAGANIPLDIIKFHMDWLRSG